MSLKQARAGNGAAEIRVGRVLAIEGSPFANSAEHVLFRRDTMRTGMMIGFWFWRQGKDRSIRRIVFRRDDDARDLALETTVASGMALLPRQGIRQESRLLWSVSFQPSLISCAASSHASLPLSRIQASRPGRSLEGLAGVWGRFGLGRGSYARGSGVSGPEEELAADKDCDPPEARLHEPIRMQANAEHIHPKPGEAGDHVAEDWRGLLSL